MPFTTFHLGPGAAVKAALGDRFSLTVFALAQVAMDLEPLVRLARGERFVHGLSHTYAGATVIGLVTLAVGRPLGRWLLRLWPRHPGMPFLNWMRGSGDIPWSAAAAGAFVGTYSHVLLDSVMHAEMRPWWPLDDGYALVGLVSMEALHLLCAVAGVAGVAGVAVRYAMAERGRGGADRPDCCPTEASR